MKWLHVGLFVAAMLLVVAPAGADNGEFNRTISVTGEGKASAPPDMAVIMTGVVTQKATAMEALAANNQAMEKVIDTLKAHKIASRDAQTSNIDVSPEYRRDERGRRQAEITGYRVTNQVRVHVRNLKDLGKVLDALIRAGSNQLSGVSFQIADPADLLDSARNRAVDDAVRRAKLYAKAAGVRVARVLAISEPSVDFPQPGPMRVTFAAESASPVPVAFGEQEIQVRIQMVFAIEDEK